MVSGGMRGLKGVSVGRGVDVDLVVGVLVVRMGGTSLGTQEVNTSNIPIKKKIARRILKLGFPLF